MKDLGSRGVKTGDLCYHPVMSTASPVERPVLQVIIASTRTGRKGPAIARWFEEFARQHGKFEVVLVDLAELKLPKMEAVTIPLFNQYINDAGLFEAKDTHEKVGRELLDELCKWAVALKTIRV